MIQSIHKRDRDLKQSTRCGELKSNFRHGNSICDSKFPVTKTSSEVDFATITEKQNRFDPVTVDDEVGRRCSSIKINERSLKDDNEARRLTATMSDTHCLRCLTRPRAPANVSNSKHLHYLSLSHHHVAQKVTASSVNECYEQRMFQFPYINQHAPRPSTVLPPTRAARNISEYQDGIGFIGSLIIKYRIHDHSKCSRKCEHPLHALTKRIRK